MANYEIKFFDFYSKEVSIRIEKTKSDKIELLYTNDISDTIGFIYLDKSTAIKLAKTLRTEINKITENNI